MAVLLPGKFIFLAHPHTGSSAMVLALQDAFPEAMDLRPHHMTLADVKGGPGAIRMEQISKQRTRVWKSTPRSGMTHGAMMPEIVRQLVSGTEIIWSVIRNPYDFMTSCFVRRGRQVAFENFVRSYNEDPYIRNNRIYYHEPDCQKLLRWENLDAELNALMTELDLPTFTLGRHNETKGKEPWESYYTPKAFENVNERFGPELSQHYELRTS